MDHSNEEKPLDATTDVDELLSLQDTAAEPKLPDPKAPPDEVLDYLIGLMRSRGVPPDYARRVAARWTVGTGRELRSYPVAMFIKMFGHDEDGWMIYKAVKTQVYREYNRELFSPSVSSKSRSFACF